MEMIKLDIPDNNQIEITQDQKDLATKTVLRQFYIDGAPKPNSKISEKIIEDKILSIESVPLTLEAKRYPSQIFLSDIRLINEDDSYTVLEITGTPWIIIVDNKDILKRPRIIKNNDKALYCLEMNCVAYNVDQSIVFYKMTAPDCEEIKDGEKYIPDIYLYLKTEDQTNSLTVIAIYCLDKIVLGFEQKVITGINFSSTGQFQIDLLIKECDTDTRKLKLIMLNDTIRSFITTHFRVNKEFSTLFDVLCFVGKKLAKIGQADYLKLLFDLCVYTLTNLNIKPEVK